MAICPWIYLICFSLSSGLWSWTGAEIEYTKGKGEISNEPYNAQKQGKSRKGATTAYCLGK